MWLLNRHSYLYWAGIHILKTNTLIHTILSVTHLSIQEAITTTKKKKKTNNSPFFLASTEKYCIFIFQSVSLCKLPDEYGFESLVALKTSSVSPFCHSLTLSLDYWCRLSEDHYRRIQNFQNSLSVSEDFWD